MGDKELYGKVRKLLEVAEDLVDRQVAVLEEINILLEGGPGIGATLKALEAKFSELWRARYSSSYVFQYKKDRPQLKRLIKLTENLDEIEGRMRRYLENDENFYVSARHSFGLFVNTFNRWAAPASSSSRPVGCHCEPACKSDAAHTTRVLRTNRGFYDEAETD